MIEIEVTKSPDQDAIGKRQFFKNVLILGRHKGDVLVDDPLVKDNHLVLKTSGKDLLVVPSSIVGHFHLNGKRTTGARKLKISDVLTIGGSHFKVISFLEEPPFDPGKFQNSDTRPLSPHQQEKLEELFDILAEDFPGFSK